MEFSYKLSKDIYLEAFRLYHWKLWRRLVVACFAMIALLDLVVLAIITRAGLSEGQQLFETLSVDPAVSCLFLLVVLVLVSASSIMLPQWRISRMYRRNPERDAIVTLTVTPEQFGVAMEGEGSSSFNWTLYKYWREGKNVIVLALHMGEHQFIPKTGLTPPQLDELRSILTKALPKK